MTSDWDKRYLRLTLEVSSWSKDPSTKVGCVIIDEKGRPVSFGFNGLPRGMLDSQERLQDRSYKLAHTIHGEINALISAGRHLDGCTVYISHPPCSHCLSQLRQAFVKRIVCYDSDDAFKQRWGDNEKTLDLAKELGIQLDIVK